MDLVKLERARAVSRRVVDEKRVPFSQLLVAHRGKIVLRDSHGLADVGARTPIRDDSIVRLYSATKPITCTAALQCWERGCFQMSDRVEQFLPEFAGARVLDGDGRLQPCESPMTVKQLFLHTAGLAAPENAQANVFLGLSAGDDFRFRRDKEVHSATVLMPPTVSDASPIPSTCRARLASGEEVDVKWNETLLEGPDAEEYAELSQPVFMILRDLPADAPKDLAEHVRALAACPLLHQPGSTWEYNQGHSVLGRLIEVWTGTSFGAFLEENIFKPLGMEDTGFRLPASKRQRLARNYHADVENPWHTVGPNEDGFAFSDITQRTTWYFDEPSSLHGCGSAGLAGTIGDYFLFAQCASVPLPV